LIAITGHFVALWAANLGRLTIIPAGQNQPSQRSEFQRREACPVRASRVFSTCGAHRKPCFFCRKSYGHPVLHPVVSGVPDVLPQVAKKLSRRFLTIAKS